MLECLFRTPPNNVQPAKFLHNDNTKQRNMTDWSKSKVVDLKAELKKRGLAQTGLKPQLVARLTAAEDEEAAETEPTTQEDVSKSDIGSAQPEIVEPVPIAPPDNQTPSESIDQGAKSETDLSKPQSQTDDHKSPLPSVEPQEAAEDRQKRKRRSLTPPLSANETARKRFRTEGNGGTLAEDVATTSDDVASVENRMDVDQAVANAPPVEGAKVGSAVEQVEAGKNEVVAEEVAEKVAEDHPLTSDFDAGSPERRRDSRFKDLFEAPQPAPTMGEVSTRHPLHDVEDEPHHVVDPAIHPATSALYIRDFMRPLNQLQLMSHLATLASPTVDEADQDLVVNFYIDLIRTHAFVSFKNVSAAVRVRSALHGSVWPKERNRKPLWVDFIPAEKVDKWIDQEKSYQAGGRSVAKKWEVVYHNLDSDQPVEATLEEASEQPVSRPVESRHPSASGPSGGVPDAPPTREFERSPEEPRVEPPVALDSGPRARDSFSTLDQLFNSTRTKPVLYWQPVSKSLADKRLDAMYDATSKDPDRSAGGDINRYSFEDGDVLVDRGTEIFPGIRPPPGFRGPARGGLSRVGFTGRGGPRGSYDSYRGGGGHRDDGRWDRRDTRDTRDDRFHY